MLSYLPPKKTFTMMSEIKEIIHKDNNMERKKVLNATFFNSGSSNFGSWFLETVIKCFVSGMYANKNKY